MKWINPKVRAGHGINQLAGDANFSGGLAHTLLQDVANTELASDLFDIDGPPLVSKARIARDYESRDLRNRDKAVVMSSTMPSAEVVLAIGIGAQIGEGENRD